MCLICFAIEDIITVECDLKIYYEDILLFVFIGKHFVIVI